MECLLPLLFLGQPEALPPFAFDPPLELQHTTRTFAPSGKTLYGSPFANQVYSKNFTVGWEDGVANPAAADAAIQALETTWTALIQDQGWQAPNSSEDHYLWVILTRDLSGTGFTTTYKDQNFPEGYPVIYLNPAYSEEGAFWGSLASHEMAHAIQYSYRDYSTDSEEPWYWEASAEWQAELSLPKNNSYGYQSIHYAEQPHLRYSSMENSHQYGMFLLNAYLEEHLKGPGTLRQIWERSEDLPEANWADIFPLVLEENVGRIFAGMAQKVAGLDFEDRSHYIAPNRQESLKDGATGRLAYLGTHYLDSNEAVRVVASGEVLLASREGIGSEVRLQAGETLAVTGLHPSSTSYALEVIPLPDGGLSDSGIDTGGGTESPVSSCACKSTSSQKAHLGIIAALCLLFLRRRIPSASSG